MLIGVHAQEAVDQLGHTLQSLLHQTRHALRLRNDLARLLGLAQSPGAAPRPRPRASRPAWRRRPARGRQS